MNTSNKHITLNVKQVNIFIGVKKHSSGNKCLTCSSKVTCLAALKRVSVTKLTVAQLLKTFPAFYGT